MTPHFSDPLVTLYLGDCLEVMAELPDASVDAVVTDPPYGLKFMGKAWDHGVPAEPFWREMLRVAKPGAYLLAFGGTRTVHRIATNIEDSGWIIRDLLMWIYASGFPKGKANLKPAHEPIVLARKPGPLRPLAIDECRIDYTSEADRPTQEEWNRAGSSGKPGANGFAGQFSKGMKDAYAEGKIPVPSGRWPSNVLLSSPELFDEPNPYVVGSGATTTTGDVNPYVTRNSSTIYGAGKGFIQDGQQVTSTHRGDSGGYSRFFLIPKADRAERERGLAGADGKRGNTHPTVKSLDLMRHLVRLVTPVGGVVLDPFLGSGTTALAASEEGFRCIGIEREAEYLDIAVGRLMATPMGLGLDVPAPTRARKLGTDKGGGTHCSFFPGPCEGHPGHGKFGSTVHVRDEEPAA